MVLLETGETLNKAWDASTGLSFDSTKNIEVITSRSDTYVGEDLSDVDIGVLRRRLIEHM
jgi:hypothetical protein